jgi:hypothetical protein
MTPDLAEWYRSEGVSDSQVERPETVLAVVREMATDGDATVVDMGNQGRRVTHSQPCRYGRKASSDLA